MPYVADIHLAGESLALQYSRTELPETQFRFEYQVGRGDTPTAFVTVIGDVDGAAACFAEDPEVIDSFCISRDETHGLFCLRAADASKLLTPMLSDMGIHVLYIVGRADGWYGTIQAASMEPLQEFQSLCGERELTLTIKQLHRADKYVGGIRLPQVLGTDLTDAQSEAVLMADDLGYFETPREASLQDIADELGISSSAAGRRISRAVNTLVTDLRRSNTATTEWHHDSD